MTMSQVPETIRSWASPMAVAPDAQAVLTAKLGPVARQSMAISAGAMLGMLRGTSVGESAR